MTSIVELVVDDSSPVVSYTPALGLQPLQNDTQETQQAVQSAGWVAQFDNMNLVVNMPTTGNGTSNHLTSRDGAKLSFDFTGSGISLLGRAKGSTYDITLDGNSAKGSSPLSGNDDVHT